MSVRTLAAVIATVGVLSEAARMSSRIKAYEAFRREFGVERLDDDFGKNYKRVILFEKRRAEVRRHNAKPGMTWTAAVNRFADYTEAEFEAMLGHRHSARAVNRPQASASLLEIHSPQQAAQMVDWSHTLNSSAHPKDQGGCGSCWAVATAGALESHLEIAGMIAEVSYEQMVDCTPNPDECGGTGGCHGATSELALEYVQKNGVDAKTDYKGYQSGGSGECALPKHSVLTIQGFVRLEENKLQPLLEAITKGPVVVSASASGWASYNNGVFDGCDKDAIINHAILAMGYGTDQDLNRDYFLIRNSWGPDWGEQGYIRLLRHSEEDSFCGTDKKPLDGVGCKGGPTELPVCGMCGILSDSAYPIGVSAAQPAKKLV